MPNTHRSSNAGWTERLADGTTISIRPISKHDAGMELQFLRQLSPKLRSARFLGLIGDPTPEVARKLTDLDPSSAAGFAALASEQGRERQIGAAQFQASIVDDECDASLVVSGDWRQRGVGSALMRHLMDAARRRGIRHVRIHAPTGFHGSDHLALRLGFRRRQDARDPATVLYELTL